MKKKGFVFIETIIVLMIVTMSLTLMLASYTLIRTKSLEKENYDKTSDKYFLYSISNLGTTAQYNYSTIADVGYLKVTPETCSSLSNSTYTITSSDTLSYATCTVESNDEKCKFFKIFAYSSTDDKTSTVEVNTSSFSKVIEDAPNCKTVFTELNLAYLYVVPDISKALKSSTATTMYDNGTINYMKTLKKCYDNVYVTDKNGETVVADNSEIGTCYNPVRYLIGVFYRYGEYYFASIEI